LVKTWNNKFKLKTTYHRPFLTSLNNKSILSSSNNMNNIMILCGVMNDLASIKCCTIQRDIYNVCWEGE